MYLSNMSKVIDAGEKTRKSGTEAVSAQWSSTISNRVAREAPRRRRLGNPDPEGGEGGAIDSPLSETERRKWEFCYETVTLAAEIRTGCGGKRAEARKPGSPLASPAALSSGGFSPSTALLLLGVEEEVRITLLIAVARPFSLPPP